MVARKILILSLIILIASGCQPSNTPAVTPTRSVQPTTKTAASSFPTDIPTLAVTLTPTAPSTLLPYAWGDRTIYRDNLIPSAQGILDGLPGASVYHIDLSIAADMGSLKGSEEVLYTNREGVALQEIYFRLFPNLLGAKYEVANAQVGGKTTSFTLEQQDSAVRVLLAQPLGPGQQVVLRLDFQTQIPGAAQDNFNIFSYADGVIALADFYPVIPAYDQQGWHIEIPPLYGDQTYTDTSFYVVQIHAPVRLKFASTGRVIDQKTEGDTQVLTLAAGPVRDFFLAASERYNQVTAMIGDTTVTSFFLQGDQQTGQQALDVTKKAFATYEKWFGTYPYTAFSVTETPTLALGVEYPQAVVIADLLYHPSTQIPEQQRPQYFESTVAHEIAHQWFYGLVGDDQVNQPWLDESMAQYDTYLYYLESYGQQAADSYKTSWEARWKRVDDQKIPIGMPVSGYSSSSYSPIVYGRGPMFFEALDTQMGADKFKTFMKDYFHTLEYGIATTSDFEQLAQKDCGCDLSGLFQEWIGK